MTLTKAIEAAREALNSATYQLSWCRVALKAKDKCEKAIATLPAEPMTEDEIAAKIRDILIENVDDSSSVLNVVTYDIIRALKDAGCLYVGEK